MHLKMVYELCRCVMSSVLFLNTAISNPINFTHIQHVSSDGAQAILAVRVSLCADTTS